MAKSFPLLVSEYAFKKSILFTDRVAVIAGPLTVALFYLSGRPVPEGAANFVALATVATLGAIIIARLLAAPYFIWRGDQAEIGRLTHLLSRPERIESEEMARVRVGKKLALAESIQMLTYHYHHDERGADVEAASHAEIIRGMASIPLPEEFLAVLRSYTECAENYKNDRTIGSKIKELSDALVGYLHNQRTIEDLRPLGTPRTTIGEQSEQQA